MMDSKDILHVRARVLAVYGQGLFLAVSDRGYGFGRVLKGPQARATLCQSDYTRSVMSARSTAPRSWSRRLARARKMHRNARGPIGRPDECVHFVTPAST
jgi:hypothetical protein